MPFKIYRSSAGSGKTFTLVKEYLTIALNSKFDDAYRGILAVTFTNKAAEEMKSRVLETLRQLAKPDGKPHAMAVALQQELKTSESELAVKAERVLKHMLHHYADISISTIDHFTHRVIRTFAQDLGLSVNFEIELDSERLTNEMLAELFERVGNDADLTAAMIDLVQSEMDDEKSWNIDDKLTNFAQVLFSEESRFHLEKLQAIDLWTFTELRKRLRAQLFANQTSIKQAGTQVMQQFQRFGINDFHLFQGSRGIHNFYLKASQGKADGPNSYALTSINDDKWLSGKANSSVKAAIDEMKPLLLEAYRTILDAASDSKLKQSVFDNLYGVALLDEMKRILTNIQQDEEVLHIGEFNHLISNVVMQESAPFIYERIGSRYSHFLVDEFQDTSVLQWFNLLPLIDESLSHDNLCLVVGDAKQSIYRWRGGDVQQFIELPSVHRAAYLQERLDDRPDLDHLLAERERTLQVHSKEQSLGSNYRSASTIVQFNNQLFDGLKPMMPASLQKMYDNGSQEIFNHAEGLVEARFFESPQGTKAWPEYAELTLAQIDTWIGACIDDGFQPGDVAIITRSNLDAVRTAQYLIGRGRNVVSNESLLINSSSKVRLLVNIATLLASPENTTNAAETIQHLGMVRQEDELTSERLMQFTSNGSHNRWLWQLLSAAYPNIKWETLRHENLFSFYETLIFGIFPNDTDPYLRYFMDEVLSFAQKNGTDQAGFIAHWVENRHKLSIALSENREAVRVLTIHKSKGLEFPVVIHPFADYQDNSSKNHMWSYLPKGEFDPLDRIRIKATSALEGTALENDLEHEHDLIKMDMFNMLYVALTRPRHRLYMCGKVKNRETKDQSPSTAIQYVFTELGKQQRSVLETFTFEAGKRAKVQITESKPSYLNVTSNGDPRWMERISISRPSKKLWQQNRDIQFGNLIHEAMATINNSSDIDRATKALLTDGHISLVEATVVNQRMHRLLDLPELRSLFDGTKEVRNEADIQLTGGKWLRPDRVVISGSKAWVLDYKTGAEKTSHRQQVEQYKDALKQLGYEQVAGLLVYLETESVITV